jgi:hypothetical protein
MGRRRRRALDGRLAIRRREDRDARGRCDRGYFSSLEILACHEAGITVTLPKPQTSGAKSDGRFGKQDFVYCQRKSNCHIALRVRKTASGYGATGPQPVKIVRLNRSAGQGQSGGCGERLRPLAGDCCVFCSYPLAIWFYRRVCQLP